MTWLALLFRNKWFYVGLAGAALIAFAVFMHIRAVDKFGKEQFDKGVSHEQTRITKKVEAIRLAAEKVSRDAQAIAQTDFRRIRSNASTLRLSGPGKAACTATVASPASERRGPDTPGRAPVVAVPAGQGEQLFGLPTAGAVALAENHDLCWARERAWNNWYKGLSQISENTGK